MSCLIFRHHLKRLLYISSMSDCTWKQKLCNQTNHNALISPERVLSKSNINNCIYKLKSMSAGKVKRSSNNKKAAVLVPLGQIGGELGFLYTVRAPHLKSNGGQVSFPGGMENKSDRCLKETALRETMEEIGILPDSVTVWGDGPEIHRPDLTVTPFLGYVGQLDIHSLNINPMEVSMVFFVTLNHLSSRENFGSTHFRLGKTHVYSTPLYFTTKQRIWGLTAMITHLFLTALIPVVYNSKIKFQPTYNKIYGIQALKAESNICNT